MPIISNRIQRIKPSATLKLSQIATELKSQGRNIISLSAGEPDFQTPEWVCKRANDAALEGKTKYTPVGGTQEIKNAILKKIKSKCDLKINHQNILVSCGAKHSIFNTFMSSINKGDEVIIPAPYWVSYPDIVRLCGGIPKIVTCSEQNKFKITPKDLISNINDKTKWIILNSPNNPTGSLYSKDELLEIGRIIKDTEIYVLSDEIYEHIIYDNKKFTSFVEANPQLLDKTITVNGVSKAYSMTGWRIGYSYGPKELIKSMEKLQSQSTSNPCSISQEASIAAILGPQDFLKEWCITFENRRNILIKGLSSIQGIRCIKPEGAFYMYASVKGLIGKRTVKEQILKSDEDISAYLLDEANVAAVPGKAFGLSPYIRFSYATNDSLIKKAIAQIDSAVRKLK